MYVLAFLLFTSELLAPLFDTYGHSVVGYVNLELFSEPKIFEALQ